MANNLKTFKKSWANLIGMCAIGIGIIILSCICIKLLGTPGWFFLISGILYELWVIIKMVQLYNNYKEIKSNIPIIKINYAKAKQELLDNGFVSSEHISSFGYNFIEYRNCFNATDNLHIEIDHENKKLAQYMLLPYTFVIKEFKQIVNVELGTDTIIKNGRNFYKAIVVTIAFNDGDSFCLSANDNIGCYENDEHYLKSMQDANLLIDKLKKLKEEQ